MLVSNITYKPVRLRMERTGNNAYSIFRDGAPRGRVRLDRDRGVWWYTITGSRWCNSYCESWLAAALAVTRGRSLGVYGRVDSYGECRAVRLQADTVWYTVIKNSEGLHIFQDYPGGSDAARNPNTAEGIALRQVRDAAQKALGE